MKKSPFAALLIATSLAFVICTASLGLSMQATASGSGGDWPMFLHDPAHSGYTSNLGPSTATVLWSFAGIGDVGASPAIVGDSVYVASSYGNMYRLNVKTGAQIWVNFKIQGAISSSPAVADGKVYVGAEDGRVYCLDAETGSQLWNYTTGGWIGSSPAVADSHVYVGSSDGNLYCFDAVSGSKLWNYTTMGPYPPGSTIGPFTSGLSSPAVDGGFVYVGGTSLYCLDASSGSKVWSFPINVRLAPAVSGGYVYVIADNGTAYCLDALTGSKVWSVVVYVTNISAGVTSPAVAHDRVYIGADGVSCLNASTGETIWSTMKGRVDPYTFGSPAVAGNYVYISVTSSGPNQYTFCLDAYEGNVIWRSETVGSGNPPAVANGVLYEGGFNVTAFGSPTGPVQIIEVATIVGAAIAVAALLVYIRKRKKLPSSSPITIKFKRRFLLAVVLTFVIIVVLAFVIFFPRPPSSPISNISNLPNPIWEQNLGHQVTDCAFDNGKAFAVDNFGNIFAFNAQTGESLWNATQGSNFGETLEVYDGNVYVSGAPSVVGKFNETNGIRVTVFSAPYDISFGYRQSAQFSLINERIVVIGTKGYAVYNASSEELFWEDSQSAEEGYIHLGNASATAAAETDSVLVRGNTVIDLDNGSALWRINGSFSEPALVSAGKVILWNYDANGNYGTGGGHIISCVTASSGAVLWNFDVGAPAFLPTQYDDLLIFGATDGNFYVLNVTDGKQMWKTHVDSQNIMAGMNLPADSKYYSAPAVSPVLVDSQSGTATWAFAVTQSGINGIEGNDLYVCVIVSLDLSNRSILWSKQIVRNGDITLGNNAPPQTPILHLVLAGNTVYLATGTDLSAFDTSSGDLLGAHHFDYGVGLMVTGDNKVFLIEDVYLMAYG